MQDMPWRGTASTGTKPNYIVIRTIIPIDDTPDTNDFPSTTSPVSRTERFSPLQDQLDLLSRAGWQGGKKSFRKVLS